MAAANVRAWNSAIKHVQQLTADPTNKSAVSSATSELLSLCDQISSDALPSATVKKIVNELQAPLHLCSALAKVAQTSPKTTGVLAAVNILRKFMSATHNTVSASSPPTPTPLQATFLQQYQQSGLPQQLPALLTAAAEELSAQAQSSAFIQYGRILAAGVPQEQYYAVMIRHHAEQLLMLHTDLCWLWPDGVPVVQGVSGSAAPAMQLALAVTQNVSSEVRELTKNGGSRSSLSSTTDMQDALKAANWSMGALASLFCGMGTFGFRAMERQIPAVRPMLLSPQLVPCFVLQLTVVALALEMKDGDIAPQQGCSSGEDEHHNHSSSGSKGKKKGSKSSGSAQQQQQQPLLMVPPGAVEGSKCPCCVEKLLNHWQLAVDKLASLTPMHLKLCELLEVEPLAVLWSAAVVRYRCDAHTYGTYLAPYMDHCNFLLKLSRATPMARIMPAQQQLHERQLHLLLPFVMMHQTASLPASHPQFAELCTLSGQISRASMDTWKQLLPKLDKKAMPQARTDAWAQAWPPAELLDEMLPLLSKLTAGLEQHLLAAGGASSSSSSSTGAGGCGCCSGQGIKSFAYRAMPALTELLCQLVQPSVWVEPRMGNTVGLAAVLSSVLGSAMRGNDFSDLPTPGRGVFTVSGLPGRVGEVMMCLERFLRHVAATADQSLSDGVTATLFSVNRLLEAPDPESQVIGSQGHAAACNGPLVTLAVAAGPGSEAQQQMHSLLATLVKALQHISNSTQWSQAKAFAGTCTITAAVATRVLVEDAGRAAAAAAAAAQSSSSSGGGGARPGVMYLGRDIVGFDPAAAAAGVDPLQQLPGLVIFGRCCMLWAQQLQNEAPMLLKAQAASREPLSDVVPEVAASLALARSVDSLCFAAVTCFEPGSSGITQVELQIKQVFIPWLQQPAVSAQLAAACYDLPALLQRLERLAEARKAAADSTDAEQPLKQFVQELQAAGEALNTLATPVTCNNPRCTNVAGPSELLLVGGKSCICGGCKTARYCSKPCQKQHWKQHRPVCKAMGAAAAAGGVPTAAAGAAAAGTAGDGACSPAVAS